MSDITKRQAWRDLFGRQPKHYVYTAYHNRGGIGQGLWGRCRCGAVLEGQPEIDAHLAQDGVNDDAQPNP